MTTIRLTKTNEMSDLNIQAATYRSLGWDDDVLAIDVTQTNACLELLHESVKWP